MSKLSDFICTDNPICGEVEVDVKEVKVSNTEYHGDLWCHMFVTDSAVQSGARDKVDNGCGYIGELPVCVPKPLDFRPVFWYNTHVH